MDALGMAQFFHEAYERLAPQFGYETRAETRVFDPESANGRLMIAVCEAWLTAPVFEQTIGGLEFGLKVLNSSYPVGDYRRYGTRP